MKIKLRIFKKTYNDKLSVNHNLPKNINVTSDINEVTKNKNLIVVTLPANTIREFLKITSYFFPIQSTYYLHLKA